MSPFLKLMRVRGVWIASLIAACGVVAAPPAQAQLSSWAWISQPSYALVDLRPGDSQAPSFQLLSEHALTALTVIAQNGGAGLPAQTFRAGWFTPTSLQQEADGVDASASVSDVLRGEGHMLAAPGRHYEGGGYIDLFDDRDVEGPGLMLSPHSRLDIRTNYGLFATVGGAEAIPGRQTFAAANATLNALSFNGVHYQDLWSDYLEIAVVAGAGPQTLANEGVLSLSLVNDTDQPMLAQLIVTASARGQVEVLTVPEPPPTSMWAVALLTGILLHRRRLRSAG